VAGCKNRDRIRAAGAADGANGLRFADLSRDFTITARFAIGNFSQCAPDVLLKRCATGQIERRDVFRLAPGENTFQRGCGRPMPAENFGGDTVFFDGSRGPVFARLRPGEHSPHRREFQPGQPFSRIARDELSVARGNGQFGALNFHQRFIQWFRKYTKRVPSNSRNKKMVNTMNRLRATRFS